jgi:hypothetical protein
MKTISLSILLSVLAFCHLTAQVVKDPLLAYYQSFDNPSQLSPTTQIYCLIADITGDGRKTILITNDRARLGPHGDYGWSLYKPVKTGGYEVIDDTIDAPITGPDYIGYIDQIKRYGAVTAIGGGKYGITVQYLDNGTIESQSIDEKRGHADAKHYPKYFGDGSPKYHVTTYTLAQLAQKYANPDSSNVIAPASN